MSNFTTPKNGVTQRAYALAFMFGVVGVGIDALTARSLWTDGLLFISGGLFALGFCFRVAPILKSIWSSSAGKWAIGGLNVVIWFIAHIPARFAVAKALGLPPQDFEVTVTIWTVAIYPAVWIFFACLLMLGIFIASMLIYFGSYISSFPFISDALNISAHLLSKSGDYRLRIDNYRKSGARYLAHAAGSGMLVIAGAAILHVSTLLQGYSLSAIPWIAYAADYQEMPAYPNVPKNQRVRLHENGVVSYATLENRSIKIQVTEFTSHH